MFKIYKNLFISTIILLGLSGCVTKRVIVVKEPTREDTSSKEVYRNNTSIKEEILIGNNSSLGRRVDEVDVPLNHPSLGIKVEEGRSMELKGQKIERIDFPIDEYRHLHRIGKNTLHGKVYLQNNINNNKILGKNIKLYLNPVTSYSRQWYQESYLGGYKLTPPDKRLFNYLKFTNSDDSGLFSFFGIPKGNYYLIGKITCGSECGYSPPRIIRLVKEIYIDNGTNNVELTKNIP